MTTQFATCPGEGSPGVWGLSIVQRRYTHLASGISRDAGAVRPAVASLIAWGCETNAETASDARYRRKGNRVSKEGRRTTPPGHGVSVSAGWSAPDLVFHGSMPEGCVAERQGGVWSASVLVNRVTGEYRNVIPVPGLLPGGGIQSGSAPWVRGPSAWPIQAQVSPMEGPAFTGVLVMAIIMNIIPVASITSRIMGFTSHIACPCPLALPVVHQINLHPCH